MSKTTILPIWRIYDSSPRVQDFQIVGQPQKIVLYQNRSGHTVWVKAAILINNFNNITIMLKSYKFFTNKISKYFSN